MYIASYGFNKLSINQSINESIMCHNKTVLWEKHIDTICAKVGAGIRIMRRMKPFVPPEQCDQIWYIFYQINSVGCA